MAMELPVEPQSLKKLSYKNLKQSLDLFSPAHSRFPPPDSESKRIRLSHKLNLEYYGGRGINNTSTNPTSTTATTLSEPVVVDGDQPALTSSSTPDSNLATPALPPRPRNPTDPHKSGTQSDLAIVRVPVPDPVPSVQPIHNTDSGSASRRSNGVLVPRNLSTAALMERIPSRWPRPLWHAPWKNYRVISGHLGWVRSIAFDPSNQWFATGSADRTIKIWDVGSGSLKLTLTGHIQQVRGLAVSDRHTYMFSAGDDKQVKCWDLEQNKVIRSYHGHLHGVYSLALHPTLDVLLTGGRDAVCRVWDIRTKTQIHVLSGHDKTVFSVLAQPTDPQVVTGSHDSTIKLWDIRKGKTVTTLTHHKKGVRTMVLHPKEKSFVSASSDNTKKFSLPRGEFLHNMFTQSQHQTIINAMAVNEHGVVATGGDDGSLWFSDWKSGYNFQKSQSIVQPGSLECEAGIYGLSYDITGMRLVTCEADKTIKMWKEDANATPETHPLNFKPPRGFQRF